MRRHKLCIGIYAAGLLTWAAYRYWVWSVRSFDPQEEFR